MRRANGSELATQFGAIVSRSVGIAKTIGAAESRGEGRELVGESQPCPTRHRPPSEATFYTRLTTEVLAVGTTTFEDFR